MVCRSRSGENRIGAIPVKRSVVPYRTYPLADLPESLQERLKNRQTPDPDFDYQSVISFSGRAWTTFVLQFLIVPAFISCYTPFAFCPLISNVYGVDFSPGIIG